MSYKIACITYSITPDNKIAVGEHVFRKNSLFKPSRKEINKIISRRIKKKYNFRCILVTDIVYKKEKNRKR